MDSRVRWLLQEADSWRREGIIDARARQALDARYAEQAAEPSLAVRSFYILGGVLLAAAVFALFAFLELRDIISSDGPGPWLMFLGFGAAWLILGAASSTLWKNRELSEAFMVAGLVQTAALVGPDPGPDWLAFLAPVIAAVVLVYRHTEVIVPIVALLAFSGTVPAALQQIDLDDDSMFTAWLPVAVAALAAITFWTRARDLPWRVPGITIAGAAAALAWTLFAAEVIADRLDFQGDTQAMVAIGLAVILATGLWLAERALVYVGGLGLTVDAIAFAFDVGGVEWGLATLIALSISLIVVATWLRGRGGLKAAA